MIENALFEFYKGDTYSRDFTISGWNREITDVYFTVKENTDNKKYVLQKILNDGITIVDDTDGKSTYNIYIAATDTDHLKANTNYIFDVEILSKGNDGGIIKRTIIVGNLRVLADITRSYNERKEQ